MKLTKAVDDKISVRKEAVGSGGNMVSLVVQERSKENDRLEKYKQLKRRKKKDKRKRISFFIIAFVTNLHRRLNEWK